MLRAGAKIGPFFGSKLNLIDPFDKKWWFFKISAKIDDFQVLPKILKNHQFLPKFWKITIFFINIWKFNIFCQNFEKKSSFFAKIWDMLLISSVLFSVFSAPQHYTALVSWCCSAVFSVVLDPLVPNSWVTLSCGLKMEK